MKKSSILGKLGACLAISAVAVMLPTASPAETITKSNIRITPHENEATRRAVSVEGILFDRFDSATSGAVRLMSIGKTSVPSEFKAQIYDYENQIGYAIVVDEAGNELSRRALDVQPLGTNEFAEAMGVVAGSEKYADRLASGEFEFFRPMPHATKDAQGRRLTNIGILSRGEDGYSLDHYEILSVSLADDDIVEWPAQTPPTSIADFRGICGPSSDFCTGSGTPGIGVYDVVWPAVDPVWEFTVTRPRDSDNSFGRYGAGVVLENVKYNGTLVFGTVSIPVINVEYEGNGCGPYRDWLDEESCFATSGTEVAPGISVGDDTQLETICYNLDDGGNWRGISIGEISDGEELHVISEMSAGWYRYTMEYTFNKDGTIEPRFAFGTVSSSCVCISRFHHVYWRFEVALDGEANDKSTGVTTVEQLTDFAQDTWEAVTTEAQGYHSLSAIPLNNWRFTNPGTGNQVFISPNRNDGTANGDDFGVLDWAVLAYNQNSAFADEADDTSSSSRIDISGWDNDEDIGTTKRTVFWMHSLFARDVENFSPDECGFVGPSIQVVTGSDGDTISVY